MSEVSAGGLPLPRVTWQALVILWHNGVPLGSHQAAPKAQGASALCQHTQKSVPCACAEVQLDLQNTSALGPTQGHPMRTKSGFHTEAELLTNQQSVCWTSWQLIREGLVCRGSCYGYHQLCFS